MNKNWPTQEKDMTMAQHLMVQYAQAQNKDFLCLFELVIDRDEKRMDFKLSTWVMMLARHFQNLYGADHGDFVTRQIISRCMIQGQTVH